MHRTALVAAAAFVAGGIATGAALSQAQPAPAPGGSAEGPPPGSMGAPMGGPHQGRTWGPERGPERGPMGAFGEHSWMRHWMHDHMGGRHDIGGPVSGMPAFALVYRHEDRALTPADVQKIAEAFLLWNGNHTWKVIDTAPTSSGLIGFSLATPDGSVIAKFTMDPHTAHLTRVG